jgi:hypothetical protein
MAWDSNTSTDKDYLDGVVTGCTYTTPGGSATSDVEVIPGSLSLSDIQGGASLGIQSEDKVFIVFESTLGGVVIASRGTLTVSTVIYTVLQSRVIENANQVRCIVRRQK